MRYAFAHRGGRAHGADNVLPTFVEALARGATGLETDAWVTADGVVVLDHDGLHRAGGPDQVSIAAVRRAELAAHIPTLEDLYATCGTDYDLAIDVKGDGAAPAIHEVALAHGAADRLWLFTESPAVPRDIGASHAGITVRPQDIRNRWTRTATLRRLAENRIEVVNMRWLWWKQSAIDDVHQHGMLAFGWDVQSSVALVACRAREIDGIFSDHVSLLAKARAGIRS